MKSLKQYITEASFLGKYTKETKIDFAVLMSPHAEERQTRHGSDEAHIISDDEILESLRKASEKIIADVLRDKISIDDRFIVRDTYTDLNIVCVLHEGKAKDELRVDVVTVIKTDKFWNTKNNWVVTIN